MRRSLVLVFALAAAVPGALRAQYFGQNKVAYGNFRFQIIQTEHFEVYYYDRERAAALDAARMAERGYARLSRILQHEWRERKPLILYASQSDFQQTNAISGELGEGTGGVTEAFKHRMVLPFTGSYADFEHVLQHEMVHAFQYDVFSRGRPGGGLNALQQINPPLWFVEGMAEYLSVGPVSPHTAMWLRDAAVEGQLPTIEQLTYDPRIFPYRYGHALWAYIGQKWGDEVIGAILQGTMTGGIERAFQRVLGVSLEQLSDEWRDAVQTMYLPQVGQHQRARRFSRAVLNQRNSKGTLHVSPQISPDGREIAYLSERDFFFVDLYLADAETGRVRRRLVRSSIDPSFETLRFINSSGAWSPDGSEFAFAAKSGGEDVLAILDVRQDRIIGRYQLGLNAITNPTWSPDGQRLVFTGYDGGWSDLYVVDADGQNLRRLTTDRFADLMPSWSPDGRTVAFTTDRGPDTDFGIMRFGNLRIALYYLDGDSVVALPGMEAGKNTNPVWSPDGQAIAFLSDRTGINNLFLYELGNGEVYQLTQAYTGISGITDLSPAISWARQADRLVFTYFEKGDYNVYAIDSPRSLKRDPYRAPATDWLALANASALPLRSDVALGFVLRRPPVTDAPIAQLPAPAPSVAAAPAVTPGAPAGPPAPATPPGGAAPGGANPPSLPSAGSIYRSGGRLRPSDTQPERPDSAQPPPLSVAALLDSATLALPDTTEFMLRPYRVRFTPDFVSRPTIGYQRDNFGRGFFGGTAIQLSDILGNQLMIFSGAVNGRLSEAQFFAAYANLSHRWAWAGGISQDPLFFYGSSSFQVNSDGSSDLVQRLRRLVIRQAFAEAYYPFNRFKRVELGARVVNISQATLNLITSYDPFGVPFQAYDSVSNEGSISYVQPSIALVHDNSLFAWTSPFFGQRYRFEVAPSFGGWRYTQLLGDYRRYDLLKFPFSFATRLVMLGRFGRDGDQFPIFIGSPDLVRGYTFGSFRNSNECTAPTGNSRTGCPEVDQLIGSRVAVANVEFRFPLIRNLTLGFLPVGFPPIEGAIFYDAGIAWNEGADLRWSRPSGAIASDIRAPVTSYGAGLRVNMFGFAVLRLDYAVPRQRPQKGGYWILSLGPPF
ncbi:MAG: PD40 domain-containing protein [Gemmatimonadetes bacterium]|nr:PD40 domain-containing protein [Gemmatimonadota bacterium]